MTDQAIPHYETPEERDAVRAKKAELTAEARENWKDPVWRDAMAQALTDELYWGFDHENLLDILSNVERVGETDRIFVTEARGLRAFWTARGGYLEASSMHRERFELQRDTIGFHVYEFEDQVRNGFGETQADLISLGKQRLDAEVNVRVLKMFQAAIPIGDPSYVSGAGVDLGDLDDALNAVFDASFEGNVTIVGRRPMLNQIMTALRVNNFSGFLPATNEEMLRRGVLGYYNGATLAYLKNYKDDNDVSFFPANEMYVVGRDASKFGYWGTPLDMEWTDQNWYWNYQYRQDFGGSVYRTDRIRRIVDTSKAP